MSVYTFREETKEGGEGPRKLVQTESEAKQLTPITKMVMDLPSYKELVERLRRKVLTSPLGIVNFVTGKESGEIIDAILLTAFPPGSGQVYKGDKGGYGFDCSTWGDAQHATARLNAVLKGAPKTFDTDDYKALEEMKGTLKYGDDAISTIAPTAAPGGQPVFGGAQAQQQMTPAQAIEYIKKLNHSLGEVRAKLAVTDPLADRKAYERLHTLEQAIFDKMESTRLERLAIFRTFHGAASYDRTGFMDFEVRASHLLETIEDLIDPKVLSEKVNAAAVKMVEKGKKPDANLDAAARKKIVELMIAKIREKLKETAAVSKPDSKIQIQKMLDLLAGDYESITAKAAEIRQVKNAFAGSLQTQQKILILQNVTDSSLVRKDNPDPGAPHIFNPRPLLKDSFVKSSVRGERAIVFVSQEPIDFTIGGVEPVTMEGGVQEPEAEALVRYFIRTWGKKFEKAGVSVSNIHLRQADMDKLKLMLLGKTHKEAIRLLNNGFQLAFKPETMELNGASLVNEVIDLNNDAAEQAAGGGAAGVKLLKPKIGKNDYIFDPNNDWGEFCNLRVENANVIRRLSLQEDQLKEQILKAQKDQKPQEVRRLEKEIAAITMDIKGELEDIPHFLVLFGEASSGKSAFAEFLASLLDLGLRDVDIGQARGMYAGMTEHQTAALIDSWGEMANVVLRLDEIDGQIASDQDAAINSHNASAVKQLLAFFNDKQDILMARNVFFVATTNNPQLLRSNLINRSRPMEVPLPLNKLGYTQWLKTAMGRLKKEYPTPFVAGKFTYHGQQWFIHNNDEGWKFAEEVWKQNIDIDKLATTLDGHRIDFRNLIRWLREAFGYFSRWIMTSEQKMVWSQNKQEYAARYPGLCTLNPDGSIGSCPEPEVTGFDLTTENLVRGAELTEMRTVRGFGTQADGQQSLLHSGFPDLSREIRKTQKQQGPGDKGQMTMDLFGDQPGIQQGPKPEAEEDILKPVETEEEETTSTAHYMKSLVKESVGMTVPKAPRAPGLKPMKQEEKPPIVSQEPSPKARKSLADRVGTYGVGSQVVLAPCELTVRL